ncbi:MAG: hypothetical protein JKX75_01970 [Gammaproteobacteria bacterium]|nr:hypothetical protein [Gammaproteobacteria bacterium]
MIYKKLNQLLYNPWSPKAVSLLILLFFLWWALINVLPLFDKQEKVTVPVSNTQVVKTHKKDSLSNLDLFGTAETISAKNTTSNTIKTKLNLTLRGILAINDDTSQGYAQIANAKKEEQYFVVKDKIFGLATLEEIYIDRVIILHNGSYETLTLPKEFLNTKHFLAAQRKKEIKKIVTEYRDLFLNRRGMELIKLFGFDTAYKNGSFIGFIIRGLGEKGRKMMKTLGIQEGDIIVTVNGGDLSSSIQAVNDLAKLKDAKSVNIEIDRSGTRLFFDFDFYEHTIVEDEDEE